jgi:hypothetical protein
MDIDATFLPVAVELIDNVFGTDVVFHQHNKAVYDPLTGRITYSTAPVAPAADWMNSAAECLPFVAGDFKSATVGDGTTSICDDITLPAGTTEFDNADLAPRSMIVLPVSPSTDLMVKAGILSRSRVEEGGPQETYEISVWVQHGATGLGFLPTTADSFTYDAVVWKVVSVEPTYSSKSLIASKIKGRSA